MLLCIPIPLTMVVHFVDADERLTIDLNIDNSDYIVPLRVDSGKVVELRIQGDYLHIYYETER